MQKTDAMKLLEQTYFVVKFGKLDKLRYNIQNLRSWSPGEALSSWALTLVPETNIEQEKIQKMKNRRLSTRAIK